MKRISRYLHGLFSPSHMQDIDMLDLMRALSHEAARKIWIYEVYQELRNINMEVDKALIGGDMRINDLSARRKAFGDVLEMILRADRRTREEKDPAPRFETEVDLDRRTV